MKFVLSIILFFSAVGIFTGLSRYSHRVTVEEKLSKQSLKVLDDAGFSDVTVKFDHFDAKLAGYVDSEDDKRFVLALIEGKVPAAYVPKEGDSGISIRPSIKPWISMTKKKGVRIAKLEGALAINAEEHRKYLGSSLYVINGVDAVENEINLDAQRLSLKVGTEFAALAAGLIPVSEHSAIRYDESGVTIGGLVENDAVKRGLLFLAEKLAPGKVTDKLKVKQDQIEQSPAELHLTRSRFGLNVSGTVPDLDSKAKLFGMLANGTGSRIGDNLDINAVVGKAGWMDNALIVIPLLLSGGKGDVEAHYAAAQVQVIGVVKSEATRDEILKALARLKKGRKNLKILSELKILGKNGETDSGHQLDLSMIFDQGGIKVTGKVPAGINKASIVAQIVTSNDKVKLLNEVVNDDGIDSAYWVEELPVFLAAAVKRISSGAVTLKGRVLTLSGTTHGIEEKQLIQNLAVNLFPENYRLVNLLRYSDQPFPSPDLNPEERTKLVEALKLLPVYFDKNSETIKKGEVKKVETAAKAILAAEGTYQFSVGGFADSVGNAAHNRELSIRRAEAVKSKLIEFGVKDGSLKVSSFGESRAGSSKRDQWKGRRVEISPIK